MDEYEEIPQLKLIKSDLESELEDARAMYGSAQSEIRKAYSYRQAMALADKDGLVPTDVLEAYDDARARAAGLKEAIDELERRLEAIEAYRQHLKEG